MMGEAKDDTLTSIFDVVTVSTGTILLKPIVVSEAISFQEPSAVNTLIVKALILCPKGIYMHPNFEKYKKVSEEIHNIWDSYANSSEAIALDEAYLDVSLNAKTIDEARIIAKTIKKSASFKGSAL